MRKRSITRRCASILVLAVSTAAASASDYPAKPIRFVVGFPPGGGGDLIARLIGQGLASAMAGEMLRVMAAIDIVHVPYKGNGPAMTDLIAGRLDCMFPTLPSALSYVKADRLRALAVTGQARSPSLPDVTTVAEAGLPGYRVVNWYGILAPAQTPAPVVDKLNGVLNAVVRSPGVQEYLANQGIASQTSTPAQFRAFLGEEIARWAAIIKTANIKADN